MSKHTCAYISVGMGMLEYKGRRLAAFHHTNLYLQPQHISVMESYDLHSESDSEFIGRRKGRKLLAEKRRRARINQCLKDIKNIVCSSQKQDPNYEKMEKAEILESTVDYLRNVRKINTTRQQVKETIQVRFQQGFSRCAEEILSYIRSLPGVSDSVHHHLRKHLSERLTHMQQASPTSPTHQVPSKSQYDERLGNITSYIPTHQHPAHAYMNLSVCTSPLREESSFTDSGLGASPESMKRNELLESSRLFYSELDPAESRKARKMFDESRVRAWVESTWSYSQQLQRASHEHLTLASNSVWRPW